MIEVPFEAGASDACVLEWLDETCRWLEAESGKRSALLGTPAPLVKNAVPELDGGGTASQEQALPFEEPAPSAMESASSLTPENPTSEAPAASKSTSPVPEGPASEEPAAYAEPTPGFTRSTSSMRKETTSEAPAATSRAHGAHAMPASTRTRPRRANRRAPRWRSTRRCARPW